MTPEYPKPSPDSPLTVIELRELALRYKDDAVIRRIVEEAMERRLVNP